MTISPWMMLSQPYRVTSSGEHEPDEPVPGAEGAPDVEDPQDEDVTVIVDEEQEPKPEPDDEGHWRAECADGWPKKSPVLRARLPQGAESDFDGYEDEQGYPRRGCRGYSQASRTRRGYRPYSLDLFELLAVDDDVVLLGLGLLLGELLRAGRVKFHRADIGQPEEVV